MHYSVLTRRAFLAAGLFTAAGFSMSQSSNKKLRVGVAEISITPSWSTTMWGYDNIIRNTDGVLDDIYAKLFLFETDKRFLLIMLDIGAIGFSMTRRIIRRLRYAIDIEPDAVAIQCTHNHSAPAVLEIPTTPADKKYQQFLSDCLAVAAEEAEKNLTECTVDYARTDSYIGLNRRVARRENTWDKDSGPIESSLHVLLFQRPTGKNIGAIVNYPTHPVCMRHYNTKISADFPGILYKDLGTTLQCPVAYLQGCCGDMIPKVFGGVKERDEYGHKLADEARRALTNTIRVSGNSIDYRAERVIMTFHAPYTLDEFRTQYPEYVQRSHWIREWAKGYLRYLEDGGDIRSHKDTLVQALRIGDVTITFLPGEILHLTSLMIRKQFPEQKLITAAYTNDLSVGYLPPADEFPKGKYEVTDSWKYYGTLQTTPDLEKRVRKTSIELIQEVIL